MNQQIYENLDEILQDSKYNGTEAQTTAADLRELEETSIWDYAFLAIFIGFLIQIVLFSFATRLNIAFYWILILLDLPILIIAVIVSNTWQEFAGNPEFVTTLARFPITNAILGSYFPIVAVTIFFFASIILFGKRPGETT